MKNIIFWSLCVLLLTSTFEKSKAQTLIMEKTFFLYYKYVVKDITKIGKSFPNSFCVSHIFEIQPNFTEKKIKKFYTQYKKSIEKELAVKYEKKYNNIYKKRDRMLRRYNITNIRSCEEMRNDKELWWQEMEHLNKNIDTFKVMRVCVEVKILHPVR